MVAMRNYLFSASVIVILGFFTFNPLQIVHAEQEANESQQVQKKPSDESTVSQRDTPSNTNDANSTSIEETSPATREENNNGVLIAVVVMSLSLFLLAMFAVYRMNKMSNVRRLLQRQFGNFSVENDTVHIYKRHCELASHSVKLSDIVSSEIFLNEVSVNNISEEASNYFSSSVEIDLIGHFNKEKRLKMVDDKVRTIELLLTDREGSVYPIRVYLRKGNQRLTRASFDNVISQVIDWCWCYSAVVHPHDTEIRVLKADVEMKPHDKPLSTPVKATPKVLGPNSHSKKVPTPETTDVIEQEPSERKEQNLPQRKSVNENSTSADIELIGALDKLANLKQQGLLSEQEFNEAKTKILEDLTS